MKMAEDRRVRKSKTAIKRAFIQLLKKNHIERITIQEISDLADINRGTFYLNFEDKYALLEEMEDEQIEKIRGIVDIRNINLSNQSSESFIKAFSTNITKKMVTHISENLEFYQVILSLDKKSKIEEQLGDIVRGNVTQLVGDNETVLGIPINYYLSYVTGSMMSIIKYWVNDPNRVSVDELVEYIATIASTGPISIMKNILDEKRNNE
nr:TetR/AcrR family transcriptional regulator [Mammaliicoccus sp. Marseille-Q6498]